MEIAVSERMTNDSLSHRDESFLRSGFGKSLSGDQTTPHFLNVEWLKAGPDANIVIVNNSSAKSITVGPVPN